MAAGRTRALYTPTNSNINPFIVDVPNNLFAEGQLGWVAPTAAGTYTRGPRLLKMRHVIGVDHTSGRRYRALVGSASADIMTGAANSWTVKDNDGTTHTVDLTGYVGEAATIDVIEAP